MIAGCFGGLAKWEGLRHPCRLLLMGGLKVL
jgi:hypothetical protein